MRRFVVCLCLLALLAVVCCSLDIWLRSPVAAQVRVQGKRLQWQYAVYYHGDLMALGEKTVNQNLSKLGEQGWELVAVAPGIQGKGAGVSTQTTYFFKRPK
jgi:hypothetical protein